VRQVFTRLLLSSLPHELGKYVVDSGEGVGLTGEIRIAGGDGEGGEADGRSRLLPLG
jgi:hypothetical protein